MEDCAGVCDGDALINECGECSENAFNGVACDDDSIPYEECSNQLGDLNIDGSWNVIDMPVALASSDCILFRALPKKVLNLKTMINKVNGQIITFSNSTTSLKLTAKKEYVIIPINLNQCQ